MQAAEAIEVLEHRLDHLVDHLVVGVRRADESGAHAEHRHVFLEALVHARRYGGVGVVGVLLHQLVDGRIFHRGEGHIAGGRRLFDRAGRMRSEERRVGKEGVSTCRSRWWRYHSKKKKDNKALGNTQMTISTIYKI